MTKISLTDYTLSDATPWRLFETDTTDHWAVLWLQGFTSTIKGHSKSCQELAEQTGMTVAILDYAGHGSHPVPLSDATRGQQLEEVLAVYDELTTRGYHHIIVIGGSFGGYLAALLASERRPRAIVMRAPANYPDDEFEVAYAHTRRFVMHDAHKQWKAEITEEYMNKATSSLAEYQGDVFVIEHGADETVDRAIPLSYFRAAKNENACYIIIPGLGHSAKDMPEPQKWFDIQRRWLLTVIRNIRAVDA